MGQDDHYPSSIKKIKININKNKNNKNTFGYADKSMIIKSRREQGLKICTFNVRSLSTKERTLELNNAIDKIKWDIIGLAEVKKTGYTIEEHKEYIFCYIGETRGLHGVGFLIKKSLKSNISSFLGISERVALLKLNFKEGPLSLIQVYSPTESSSEEEITEFYNDLTKAQELADKNRLIIGDFNAKIGQPKPHENLIMGKYGYGIRNARGARLIQYAHENKLAVMNTYFKKKSSRKWTWISPDHKTKNEIDFIMSPNPKSVTNVEVLNKISFPSDHRILRCSIKIQKPKMSRGTFQSTPNKLKSTYEKNNYIQNLKKNIPILQEFLKENKTIQNFSDKLEEVIRKSLKMNEKANNKHKEKIISENTQDLICRRTELMFTKNKSKEMREELKKLFKQTNRLIKRDYANHRRKIIEKNMLTFRSSKRAFKELSTHKNWIQSLNSEKGENKDRKGIIECATAFYTSLYKKPPLDMTKDDEKDNSTINEEDLTETPLEPITEREIMIQIKRLKPEKSPGEDNITNEALKIGAPFLVAHLAELFNLVLEKEQVPSQWSKSNIILLYKKGDPLDISNYRPISLLSTIYKLFSSIILTRIAPDIDRNQPIEQAGFRPHYSTIDHIHTLEQIIEKFKEFNQPLYLAFVDYSKAFDSIAHSSIWTALRNNNVNKTYVNIIKNIYSKSVSRVKLEKQGEEFVIGRGVRQGDPLSPKLFIAVLEDIFKNINWNNKGIWIFNNKLTHLRFADDIVLFSKSATDLELLLQRLNSESKKIGLNMNASKTKIMSNSQKKIIQVEGKIIEYENEYVYLGKLVSFDSNSNENEIDRRTSTAWKKYWAQKEILKGNYSLNIKKTIMDSCILPSLTYASQTWVFTEKVKNKISSCQHAMERSILKLRKIQKTRNSDIRMKTKLTDALNFSLKQKWSWAGHLSRYEDKRWTYQTTKWQGPIGKRNVGRQRKRWADDIINTAGKNWMHTAKDRDRWKTMEEAFTRRGAT